MRGVGRARGSGAVARSLGFARSLHVAAFLCAGVLVAGCSGGDGKKPPVTPPETPRVNSITLSPSSISFDALGDTIRLTASILDQFGNVMTGQSITWVSGDATVATVDQSGLVRSVRVGETHIRAQAGLKRDTVPVTVTQVPKGGEIVTGNHQLHWTGFVLPDTLQIRIWDRVGTAVKGVEVTWEILSGGGLYLALDSVSDEEGRARALWMLGDTATGVQRIAAMVEGLSPFEFEATGSAPLAVLNESELTAPMLDTLGVVFLALDSLGVPEPGVPVEVLGLAGYGKILPGPTTTDINGRLVARWELGPSPGMQQLLVQRSDLGRQVLVEAEGTGTLDPWPFVQVGPGAFHTCAVDDQGTAYCWGRGSRFRLGTGTEESTDRPTPVVTALTWTAVVAGDTHSCGLTAGAAQVYCWGRGYATGQAPNVDVLTPTAVPGGPWTSIASGDAHVCVLAPGGAAFCWGENGDGRLGGGTTASTQIPTQVLGGHTFAQVSTGRYHTCGLTTGGAIWCWGRGDSGQLGDGTAQTDSVPRQVAGGFQWKEVAAGWTHTCGIEVGGDAFCWGEGSRDELGNGISADQTSPVKVAGDHEWQTITAGRYHSCGIDTGGTLYCWGRRGLVGIGPSGAETPAPVMPEVQWKAVRSQHQHTCAITVDGRTYCWGPNADGQLGIRSTDDFDIPRLVFRGVILP